MQITGAIPTRFERAFVYVFRCCFTCLGTHSQQSCLVIGRLESASRLSALQLDGPLVHVFSPYYLAEPFAAFVWEKRAPALSALAQGQRWIVFLSEIFRKAQKI